jgi:hypothetical protein
VPTSILENDSVNWDKGITTPEELIIGQGMEADTRFTKYTLHKVTGILKIKE